jgi:YbgC/YbaW family acyl-CoA thioester hydrolase
MFVVSDVKVQYLRPARLDDELVATADIRQRRGASLVMVQRVLRGDEVLARGEVTIACVDRAELQPRRLPREMIATLPVAAAQP